MSAVDQERSGPGPGPAAPGAATAGPGAPTEADGHPTSAPVWAPPPPGPVRQALDRRPWLAPAAVGVALGLGAAYTAWQDPTADGVFPACPLREMTGWDCPGCGGLRATHALLHGNVTGALDHNLFLAVAVPVVALLWLRWMLGSLGVRVPRLPRVPRAVWGVLAFVVLAFTVVRNIPGVALFEYLNSFT